MKELPGDTMGHVKPFNRRWFVVPAALWALLWTFVVFCYHINEPVGMLSLTTNGHTYIGNPPALTLFERDRMSVWLALAVAGAAFCVTAAEILIQRHRRSPGHAMISRVAGGLLIAYSVLGLLWGLASIGVVGSLVVLSSTVSKRATFPAAQPPTASSLGSSAESPWD